jgi:hypothetical protein
MFFMKTERAKFPVRRAVERASERSRGVLRAYVGMSATRFAEIHIGDASKLPVEEGVTELQNEDGQNYFLPGYSKVGGPDVLA